MGKERDCTWGGLKKRSARHGENGWCSLWWFGKRVTVRCRFPFTIFLLLITIDLELMEQLKWLGEDIQGAKLAKVSW